MTKITQLPQTLNADSPRFIDVFAGCGGLSLGLLNSGWRGVFAVEHDSHAFSTLRHNLVDETAHYRFAWPDWLPIAPHGIAEILQVYESQLIDLRGSIDMIVGGPPCQGFSSAGRRNPADPRNRLVESYLRLVDLVQPNLVLIENVKGITQDFDSADSESGKLNYAAWILSELSKSYDVSSKMVDTARFGVPQRRQRFFIIGVRKGIAKGTIPEPFKALEKGRRSFLKTKGLNKLPVTSRSAISDLTLARNGELPSCETRGFQQINYRGPMTVYQKLMHGQQGPQISDTRLARHKPLIRERFQKIIKVCQAENRLNVSLSKKLKSELNLKKCAIRVLDPRNLSPTITSMPDDLLHYSEPRTLTVRENARLQSFPDWFEFKGKYTSGGDRRKKEVPRFTQVANAVPPLMAEALGYSLKQLIIELQGTKHSASAQSPRLDSQRSPGTLKAAA